MVKSVYLVATCWNLLPLMNAVQVEVDYRGVVRKSAHVSTEDDKAANETLPKRAQVDEPCDEEFDLDAALKNGSRPDVPARLPRHVSVCKKKANKFSENVANLWKKRKNGHVNPFYPDLVTGYYLTLWNLTNYSVMVKNAKYAPHNKLLLHKMGANVTDDLNLLHDKVSSFYELMHGSPWGASTIQKHCKFGDFRNLEKCMSIGMCLIRKGVHEKQINPDIFEVFKELNMRYLSGNHHAVVQYVKKTKPDESEQQLGLSEKSCDSFIEHYASEWKRTKSGEKVLLESEWAWLNNVVSDVKSDVSHAASDVENAGKTIVNAAEYGAHVISSVATEADDVMKKIFNCVGMDHSPVTGYNSVNFLESYPPAMAKVTASLTTVLPSKWQEVENVWHAILNKNALDAFGGVSLTANLGVDLGVGFEAGSLGGAEAGVSGEVALQFQIPSNGKPALTLDVKVGASAGLGSPCTGDACYWGGCPFGDSLGGALTCESEKEVSLSLFCCDFDLFTGDHQCR